MIFDSIEWDEHNLDHACRRFTQTEIEQVITNATSWRRHSSYADRAMFCDYTDGGKKALVVARYDITRRSVRLITAWEEK